MANDGKSGKPLKLDADIKDAIQSLKELERQANKIGDLANQGENQQKGFLSKKQVQMYRNIMREVEQSYNEHKNNLYKMEQSYNQKTINAQRSLQQQQSLLNNAMGGNRWGNTSSPAIQAHLQNRVQQAQANIHHISSISGANVGAYANVLQSLNAQRGRSQNYAGRIDSMHQANPNIQRFSSGLGQMAYNSGMVLSPWMLSKYVGGGMDTLRKEEYATSQITQKMGGYGGNDAGLRLDLQKVGLGNQYSNSQSLQTQAILGSGGMSGNVSSMLSDLNATQKFGRAYGVDPDLMASSGSSLRKMGTYAEGEMSRFANLIGGAVAKNSMRGREEEMIRATTSLIQSVGSNLVTVTDKQAGNIVSLQTALGDALPTLKGERGAAVLANMDSAVKGGGANMDLLARLGTDDPSGYYGVEGVAKKRREQDKGITGQYFRDALKGSFKVSPNNSDLRQLMFAGTFGTTDTQFKELDKSGFIKRLSEGEFTDEDIKSLEAGGMTDQANQLKEWQKTRGKATSGMESKSSADQAAIAKPTERIATGLRSAWHSLPVWMQGAGVFGAGMFGGSALNRLSSGAGDALTRMFSSTIGNNGGGSGILSNLRTTGSNLAQLGAHGGRSLIASGGRLLGSAGRLLGRAAMPLAVATSAYDVATSDNKVKAASGAVGGLAGAYAGAQGGALVGGGIGAFFGGAGAVPGAAIGGAIGGIGGFFGGKALGNSAYDAISSTSSLAEKTSVGDTLEVKKLVVQGQELTEFMKNKGGTLGGIGKDMNVNINISGRVEGMTEGNQERVTTSIVDYFKDVFGVNRSGFNLSMDQVRR